MFKFNLSFKSCFAQIIIFSSYGRKTKFVKLRNDVYRTKILNMQGTVLV